MIERGKRCSAEYVCTATSFLMELSVGLDHSDLSPSTWHPESSSPCISGYAQRQRSYGQPTSESL